MQVFRARSQVFLLLYATAVTLACGVEIDVGVNEHTRVATLIARNIEPGTYEWRVQPLGLAMVETGGETNEPGIIYLPPATGPVRLDQKVPLTGAENIFFFNSLARSDRWELAVRFSSYRGQRGTWKLNGRFSTLAGDLREEVVIRADELEPGENLLHVTDGSVGRPEFSFRRQMRVEHGGGRELKDELQLAQAPWSATVALVALEPTGVRKVLARVEMPRAKSLPPRHREVPDEWWKDGAAVAEAARAAGKNILANQITDDRSFFAGGFHLVYDVERESHRMPHWIWAWGPAIAFLLKLEKQAHAEPDLERRWRAAALAAGKRSLAFGIADAGHAAAGISTVRWDPSRAVPGGWVEYISTADSLFLAGWGWMSLHALTGEAMFLERTQALAAAGERLMAQYPVVPQDWVVQRERWTPHTLDESVFGMIGFRALHAATGDGKVADAGKRFLDSHLKHMDREDGLLERAWLREERRAIWDPDIKGHAWVVEGYLDAHAMTGEVHYLQRARDLAGRVLKCQGADGSWTYLFKKPVEGDSRDDKGTAIWAYMLYRLYRKSGDAAHLAAARRAVWWCLAHQYRGDHPQIDGGLLNENSMAYVRRRPMTILYSTTFFGLALLEEMALAPRR